MPRIAGESRPGKEGSQKCVRIVRFKRHRIMPVDKTDRLDRVLLRIHDPVSGNPEALAQGMCYPAVIDFGCVDRTRRAGPARLPEADLRKRPHRRVRRKLLREGSNEEKGAQASSQTIGKVRVIFP